MTRKRHKGHRIAPNTRLGGENMSLMISAGSPEGKTVAARSVHITLVKQENILPHLAAGEPR